MKLKFEKNYAILVDEKNKPITNKNWFEVQGIAIAMSKRYEKKIRVMPIKKAVKLMQTDNNFRKLMIRYWAWADEIFIENQVKGKTLKQLIGLPKDKIWYDNLNFWNNLSAVWFGWNDDEVCPDVYSVSPLGRLDVGVAVFEVRK